MRTYGLILTVCTFLLCGLAGAGAGSGTEKARIINGPINPVQDIFEVTFVGLDGKNIAPRTMLTLEPGDYTLTVDIPAQYTRPAFAQRLVRRNELVDIDLTVEAGQDYSLRGKWNRGSLQEPWELLFEPFD